MPVNKFKLKAALADIDSKGIEVGDVVKVEWSVDAAYGGGTRSHAGVLKSFDREDGWFEIAPSNRSPGHLRSSITSMGAVMTKLEGDEAANVRREAAKGPAKPQKKSGRTDSSVATPNPFVAKSKKKDNPFMKKAAK